VLVTHYVDCLSLLEENRSTNAAAGAEEGSSSSDDDESPHYHRPWPASHRVFAKSPAAQQLLSLEIASGGGGARPQVTRRNIVEDDDMRLPEDAYVLHEEARCSRPRPKLIQKDSSVPILIPGSLRERGEFCVVDMALLNEAATSHPCLTWQVQHVHFHQLL
jgi:hypothetical protein